MPTGANDVLVVGGDEHSIDLSERLIPYVLGQFVTQVNLEEKIIEVDWDPDF
jgi:16S rRNA processing protein RimM